MTNNGKKMSRLRVLLFAAAALGSSSATLSGALTALTMQPSLPAAASIA